MSSTRTPEVLHLSDRCLGTGFPKFGKQSKAVLRSLVNLEQDMERILAALVNEISSQIDQHFALVVDDYQFVDSVPDIRNLFSRSFTWSEELPPYFILTACADPPDITLMVARQQVGGFDLEELAFSPNEIRSLFEIIYGMSLDDRLVEVLMQQTEGWITGLLLSASSLTSSLPDLTRAARTAGVNLAGYLDQEVLAPQPLEYTIFCFRPPCWKSLMLISVRLFWARVIGRI